MKKMRRIDTKQLTVLAMIAAMAFVLAAVVRFPLVSAGPLTLRYDPKDIIMVIGGFIYGPLAIVPVAVIVPFIQMISVSATGYFGFIMNVITSVSFCCTAAFIYKRNRSLRGAVIGLIAGAAVATALAMPANIIIAPLFMGVTHEAVARMLVPVFLPFNLINNSINAAITLILYKHLKMALQSSGLVHETQISQPQDTRGRAHIGVLVASAIVLAACVVWVLVMR